MENDNSKYTKEDVIRLLQEMQLTLHQKQENRFPKRADFPEEEVVAIKAYLGPWPRALEAAGLKPERSDDVAEKRLQKRIAVKRKRTARKIQAQKNTF